MREPRIRWGLFFSLCLAVGFFMAILPGCGGAFAPGSPNVTINKNVIVTTGASSCEQGEQYCLCEAGDVTVFYSTKSETGITSKIEQQLEDLFDMTLKLAPR